MAALVATQRIVSFGEKTKFTVDQGSNEAHYAIGTTGVGVPNSKFAFDRINISAGHIVHASGCVAIGKNDKPRRATKTNYHRQVEGAEQLFAVLYDCKDRRAWLIDGASALLHLCRANLARRRNHGHKVLFSDDNIEEAKILYKGKDAAMGVLLNEYNMNLKIYERWNLLVEGITIKGDGVPGSNQ
ncbi:hypothetical protein F4776DRAFT_662554 [Hypoxylon sp. NC0597]|nr:hypothetical protein F4776DRAFT_662554 [Hypoxylon sp. NC0597]